MPIPARGLGADTTARPTPKLSPIDEEHTEEIMDEDSLDAVEIDRASHRSTNKIKALQLLLNQFDKSQCEDRKLRTQEFQALMGMLRLAARASSIQPLVRNAPNFTK